MKFTTIASSSKGNAYLAEAEGIPPLLIEAGIPAKQLREKLPVGLSTLAGCLISHEHTDHSRAVKSLLKAGVDCYMSSGTAVALDILDNHRVLCLLAGTIEPVNGWKVLPFALNHDAAGPLGFLIGHKNERLLFIPDTAYVKQKFKGITILAIECNYIQEILSENILNGSVNKTVGNRIRQNHMNLKNLIAMLKENNLSLCREIWLLHLSSANSNEKRMIKEVQEATGIPTYAA